MLEASINTNVAQKTALQSLSNTKGMLRQTQEMISTGKKINGAKDGPSSFATAQTMKGDVSTFKKLEENLGLNQQIMSVASKNAEQVTEYVNKIKEGVTAAYNGARGNEEVQGDIETRRNQIQNTVEGAQFNGINMLNQRGEQDMLMSINRDSQGVDNNQIEVQKRDLNVKTADGGLNELESFSVVGMNDAGSTDIKNGTTKTAATVSLDINGKDDVKAGRTISITASNTAGSTATETFALVDEGTASGERLDNGAIAVDIDGITGLTSGNAATKVADEIKNAAQNVTNSTGASVASPSSLKAPFTTAPTATPPGSTKIAISESTGSSNIKLLQNGGTQNARVDSVSDGFHYDTVMDKVETAQQDALDAASDFGSKQQRLESQQEFVGKLKDTLDSGVGEIVDANMAEQAAKLQALQAQQQLGNQSLSIANRQPQSLLSLFGG